MRAGVFTWPGSTGPHTFTDAAMCFTPKAIIFRWINLSSYGYSGASSYHSLGFADDALNQYAVGTRTDAGVNPNGFWAFTYPYPGNCIQAGVGGATLTAVGDGSFTLNFGTSGPSGDLVEYWAFGGDDCLAKVKRITPTTGSQSFTGYGFQGQLLMWLDARGLTENTEDGHFLKFDVGFASGSASNEQWSLNQECEAGVSPSQATCQFKTGVVDVWGNTTLTSWDADGFTINIGGNYGSAPIYTLVLGDSAETSFKVGNDTQKTSTGTKSFTGVGFEPGALLAGGVCDTNTIGTVRDNAYMTFGGYDGFDHNCSWKGATKAQNPTVVAGRLSNTVLISHSQPATTTNAEASVSSLDADGVTLNWTTADATARAFGFVFFKCVPGNPCPNPPRASFDEIFVI